MVLKTNVIYKYGLDEKTITVVFKKPYNKVQITNTLCGGDPVYGELKYLYDEHMNIICKEYDYINIIDESLPINSISDNLNLFSKGTNVITITMPTWSRLEYVIPTIKSLKIAYDNLLFDDFKQNIILIFSCEPFKDVIDYIDSIDWIKKIVLKNNNVLGVRHNPYNCIDYAFEYGSIFNLHLEDDIIYSKHLLNLFYYYYTYMYDIYFIYGFFCYIDKNTTYINNDIYKLTEGRFFAGLGWACSKSSWNDIKKVWFIDHSKKHIGWDFSVGYLTINHTKNSICVCYPYTQHIGDYGTHATKKFNDNTFKHIQLYNEHDFDVKKFYIVVKK